MMRASAIAFVLFAVAGPVPGAQAEPIPAAERERLDQLERSEADFQLGLEAQRRGRLPAARTAYQAALERDEGFVEAMANLARVHAALGELDEAERWLARAAVVRPGYPGVSAARGLVALARDDVDLAIEELTRARVQTPDDVEVLTNLGAALIRAGLWQEAIEHLDRAQRLDPHRGTPSLNLALAHEGAGDTTRAVFHYRRYLQLARASDPLRPDVEARLRVLAGQPTHSPSDTNGLEPTSATETASTQQGAER